ncbi:hypothetical protein Afe04nite_31110 [Asanoa ferruginea]|nr:hypothetical protein Afe04nite_31110 [Asanoa ferruginea]
MVDNDQAGAPALRLPLAQPPPHPVDPRRLGRRHHPVGVHDRDRPGGRHPVNDLGRDDRPIRTPEHGGTRDRALLASPASDAALPVARIAGRTAVPGRPTWVAARAASVGYTV